MDESKIFAIIDWLKSNSNDHFTASELNAFHTVQTDCTQTYRSSVCEIVFVQNYSKLLGFNIQFIWFVQKICLNVKRERENLFCGFVLDVRFCSEHWVVYQSFIFLFVANFLLNYERWSWNTHQNLLFNLIAFFISPHQIKHLVYWTRDNGILISTNDTNWVISITSCFHFECSELEICLSFTKKKQSSCKERSIWNCLW